MRRERPRTGGEHTPAMTELQAQDLDRNLATALWEEGLERQLAGELDEAMGLYRSSLDLWETAEAHTFLGWGLSFQGLLDAAIDQCQEAIRTDPELGNPYNDTGAYLVELDREEEAILWFERAKDARRYENPQFPYLNLARIWIGRCEYGSALLELQVAEVLAPHDPRVEQLVDRVGELLTEWELPPMPAAEAAIA